MGVEINNSMTVSKLMLKGLCENPRIAIDATLGKGNDALFLLAEFDSLERVIGLDIQEEAISLSRETLGSGCPEGLLKKAELILGSHEDISNYAEEADIVVFNLGYLPGIDKTVTTKAATTVLAVKSALSILNCGGVVSIVAYPGHDSGRMETEALMAMASSLDQREYNVVVSSFTNQRNDPPVSIMIQRRSRK